MNIELESFEEAMEVLKTTVNKFDDGKSLNLEDLIQNYEKGMLAYSYCINKLEETQKKIEIIDNGVKE